MFYAVWLSSAKLSKGLSDGLSRLFVFRSIDYVAWVIRNCSNGTGAMSTLDILTPVLRRALKASGDIRRIMSKCALQLFDR